MAHTSTVFMATHCTNTPHSMASSGTHSLEVHFVHLRVCFRVHTCGCSKQCPFCLHSFRHWDPSAVRCYICLTRHRLESLSPRGRLPLSKGNQLNNSGTEWILLFSVSVFCQPSMSFHHWCGRNVAAKGDL